MPDGTQEIFGLSGQATLPLALESGLGDGPKGKVTQRALMRLLDAQHKRCALTGVDLTPETVSLDHITPLQSGGEDCMSNVQLVHAVVNSMKGTMSQVEFVRWCRRVASHCVSE